MNGEISLNPVIHSNKENLFNMKKVSKKLFSWADTFVISAVILLVASFVGFIMDSAWCGNAFNASIILFILSPFARGFAVLVQNAEEQLDERWMVKIKNAENEDEK